MQEPQVHAFPGHFPHLQAQSPQADPQVEHPKCPGTTTGFGAGVWIGLGAVPHTTGGFCGLLVGVFVLLFPVNDKAFLPVLFSLTLMVTGFGLGDLGILGFGLLGLFGASGELGFLKVFEYDKSIDGLSTWGTLGPLGILTLGTWLGFGTFGNWGTLTWTFGGDGTDDLYLYGCFPLQGGGGGT